jgi:hypothetical protein
MDRIRVEMVAVAMLKRKALMISGLVSDWARLIDPPM